MTIRAVVFDVGETLVDETDAWGDWADWLGVPRLTLFGVLGAVIARGGDHREVFEVLRPGLDVSAEIRARQAAGRRPIVTIDDLYPDALDCLRRLATAGYRLGIAGNQPTSTESVLHALGVPLEIAASSEGWGVAKPDPAFFGRILAELDLVAGEVAYVGDRLDNDVEPAARAGLAAIFIRRGPWAFIQASDGREVAATATIDSLAELPEVLARLG
ncbi:MAG TPA: HAD family hydrolase [Candidatus Limnocylindrales bacterium]|nr:HAD family hydrolase [Candidatus Limnocylindrales bacterium]